MKKLAAIIILISSSFFGVAQSVDDPLSKDKMRKDLDIFKQIRIEANSKRIKSSSNQIKLESNQTQIESNSK